jgi:hypothetical protein
VEKGSGVFLLGQIRLTVGPEKDSRPLFRVCLSAEEFLRRWVQHVLPRGFVKIRHYGLVANRDRSERLAVCRALLTVWVMTQVVVGMLGSGAAAGSGVRQCCPVCGSERWLVVAEGEKGTA